MTITQLKYIITLEKTRNFTKAANLCKVSQPTLSMQIQKVEEGEEKVSVKFDLEKIGKTDKKWWEFWKSKYVQL